MNNCAYCFKKSKLTKEHIIPKFLYSFMKDCGGDQSGFNTKSNSLIKSEAVIKDVCGECNSGQLSILDSYGKKFFEDNNLFVCEHTNNQLILNYDYNMLLRWLLKICYNSFRAAHKDPSIYDKYINYIINGTLSSELKNTCLIIELLNITPSNKNHNKFSVFLSEEMKINDYLFVVTAKIGAVCFYITIFKPELKNWQKKKIAKKFINANGKNMTTIDKKLDKITISKTTKTLENFMRLSYPING